MAGRRRDYRAVAKNGGNRRDSSANHDRPWYLRPRLIYIAVFAWISINSGRFTASFLEAESSSTNPEDDGESSSQRLDSGQIGTILALQRLVMVVCGSVAGIWADRMEQKHPNRGRILCLGGGCSLGTVFFCLHGLHRFSGKSDSSSLNIPLFQSVHWFVVLRIAFAAVTSLVFPIVDGICLDFLKRQSLYDDAIAAASDHKNTDHDTEGDCERIVSVTSDGETTSEAKAETDATDDYGKERLYGAISWAVTNLLLGPILDHYNGDFWAMYPLSIVSTVLLWIAIVVYMRGNQQNAKGRGNGRSYRKRDSNIVLPDDDVVPDLGDESFEDESNLEGNVTKSPFTEDGSTATTSKLSYYLSIFAVFVATKYTIAFLICVTTLASGQAIVNDLIFLFFEFLGSSYTLMSVTVVLTVVFEIPIFQVAPRLLQRFGCNGLLVVASLAYVVRVLGYTLVPKDRPLWVVLLEPLHGITYACSQTASVSFVATKLVFGGSSNSHNTNRGVDGNRDKNDKRSSDSNDGTEATGQGFLQFFVGFGSVLGLELGGLLQDSLGPRTMYRISALVVMIGCTIFVSVAMPLRPRIGKWVHQAIPQALEEDVQINTGNRAVGENADETKDEVGTLEMIATK